MTPASGGRCPRCGALLTGNAGVSPVPRDPLQERLATDEEFAQRYHALNQLARTGAPGPDLADQAEAIAKDEPMLADELAASNREAKQCRVKKRFKARIQFGLLRRRQGRYRGLPEVLPKRECIHDRIFPRKDTLSWILVCGKMTPRRWWPTRKWLTKQIVAAMLELKESTVDVLMRKGHLHRIPLSEAPVKDEACFWTEEVMSWPRMQKKMRDYQLPV